MIQLTKEQSERLKQIREQHQQRIEQNRDDTDSHFDIDFLLSLYERQLAENERLNSIVSAYENQDEEALAEAYENPLTLDELEPEKQ